MTTGIVIVVHAPLGAAMRECASHVMGNLDGMLAIHDIQPEDLPDDWRPRCSRISWSRTMAAGCWC